MVHTVQLNRENVAGISRVEWYTREWRMAVNILFLFHVKSKQTIKVRWWAGDTRPATMPWHGAVVSDEDVFCFWPSPASVIQLKVLAYKITRGIGEGYTRSLWIWSPNENAGAMSMAVGSWYIRNTRRMCSVKLVAWGSLNTLSEITDKFNNLLGNCRVRRFP